MPKRKTIPNTKESHAKRQNANETTTAVYKEIKKNMNTVLDVVHVLQYEYDELKAKWDQYNNASGNIVQKLVDAQEKNKRLQREVDNLTIDLENCQEELEEAQENLGPRTCLCGRTVG